MTSTTLIRLERFGTLTASVITVQTADEFSVHFQVYGYEHLDNDGLHSSDDEVGVLQETFVSKCEITGISRFDAWVKDQQETIAITERRKLLDAHAKSGVEINDAQGTSLYRKYRQDSDGALSFAEFVSRAEGYGDYIGIEWCGMFLGIEQDGYTHS